MEADGDHELDSSELGTKKYWDHVYQSELNNFTDHGDIGEIWFGEESIFRIIEWLKQNYKASKDEPVVDLGCGNGMMLIELARDGFRNLVGVDYSEQAIQLSSSVVSEQGMKSCISLKVCDIVNEEVEKELFALALDKGTYDAVSLHPDNSQQKRQIYIRKVHKLLQPEGLFIITSCNWTDEELVTHFKEYFKLYTTIPTPQFRFGGKVGNIVSCIVLQRIN